MKNDTIENELPDSPEKHRGLSVLAELHDWEHAHMPFITTATGRALYFSIVREFFSEPHVAPKIKSFNGWVSDKSLRVRLQEFESLGLVHVQDCEDDKRNRCVVPTPKLIDLFEQHRVAMQAAIKKRFYYVNKEETPETLSRQKSKLQKTSRPTHLKRERTL